MEQQQQQPWLIGSPRLLDSRALHRAHIKEGRKVNAAGPESSYREKEKEKERGCEKKRGGRNEKKRRRDCCCCCFFGSSRERETMPLFIRAV